MHPTGGLARRATFVSKKRSEGPTVLVDGGDALSRVPTLPPGTDVLERETAKAELIVKAMGKLEYAAMAVGERDLAFGVDKLLTLAREQHLPLLAANLVNAEGRRVFEAHRVVDAGGTKVGIFAVVGDVQEYGPAGLKVNPAMEVAQGEIAALQKEGATFIVALLHMNYDQGLKLANDLKGIDFAVQSHDGRTSSLQLVGDTELIGGGERGRTLGVAAFTLGGEKPYYDLSDSNVAADQLRGLEANIEEVKSRIQKEPANAKQYEAVLTSFQKRREELQKRMEGGAPPNRRTVKGELAAMDEKVEFEPQMKGLVDAYVAKYGTTVQQH